MTTPTTTFKIGDLIFIVPGVHDKMLPSNRTGVIVGFPPQGQSLGTEIIVWNILFTNGEILKFHQRWMARVYNE
tara:strand:- start:3115 stop:3336 length:222 start_codon:yes stop_codon:yes gene_type:complete